MKLLSIIVLLSVTGCAYNNGQNTWYPGQPIPYKVGAAWSPQPMPGQSVYIVNGQAVTVYKASK